MEAITIDVNKFQRNIKDDKFIQKLSDEPIAALKETQTPLRTDKWIYRIIVLVLGFAVLFIIVGCLILLTSDPSVKPPEIFIALGSAAIGALTGLLIPPPPATN